MVDDLDCARSVCAELRHQRTLDLQPFIDRCGGRDCAAVNLDAVASLGSADDQIEKFTQAMHGVYSISTALFSRARDACITTQTISKLIIDAHRRPSGT